MKKIISTGVLLLACFSIFYCSNSQAVPAAKQRIIILRHGEKPDNGDNLSCQGFNRALELPAVIEKKFGIVAAIYVPTINTGKSTGTSRMYQTAMPYAIKNNLIVNSKFDVEDTKALAAYVMQKGGDALVIWEHKNIDNLARALGVTDAPKWEGSDFDTIWVITMENGKATLAIEKESLQPKAACAL